jgi:hypothetical protein
MATKTREEVAFDYVKLVKEERDITRSLEKMKIIRREMESKYTWLSQIKGSIKNKLPKGVKSPAGVSPRKRARVDDSLITGSSRSTTQTLKIRQAKIHHNQIKMKLAAGKPVSQDLVKLYISEASEGGIQQDDNLLGLIQIEQAGLKGPQAME